MSGFGDITARIGYPMAGTEIGKEVIEDCLRRLAAGDLSARNELLAGAADRLLRLTRRLKRDFPGVGRWEQTDDVFQGALLRLYQSFKTVKIESSLHFYRLAALQIRRELLDLCRHYQGRDGVGAHYASWVPGDDDPPELINGPNPSETTSDPHGLAEWADFHRLVEGLSEEDREMFDLLWYAGLNQSEAAEELNLSLKTIQRRWRGARLRLSAALDGKNNS